MNPTIAQSLCEFPARLHPVSQMFLDAFLQGRLARADFLRFFSLPNSDYIPLGQCLVQMMFAGVPAI